MAKQTTKEYAPDDDRVATFRIKHRVWEEFQTLCAKQGKSASESIITFIDSVIDGAAIPSRGSGEAQGVEELRSELETMRQRLDGLVAEWEEEKEKKPGGAEVV